MAQPQIYLLFNGNCEAAFNHYARVLGGKIEMMMRFGESPEQGDPSQKDLIMHTTMDVNGAKIMGSDAGSHPVTVGNNFSISINPDTEADADRIFNALAEGGQVTMPMSETFWAKKFGMCTDKFGINWMISYSEVKEPA